MTEFPLKIVTPDKQFYDDKAEMLIAKTTEGYIGVLAHHIPLVTILDIGIIRIRVKGEEKLASVAGGILKVEKDGVILLADAAEWPHEIDIQRAREAKKRAEERLKKAEHEDIDVARAQAALRRALIRIELYNS